MFCGLEGDKITGLSIRLSLTEVECIKALEVEEITGFSNQDCSRGGTYPGLEEDKITRHSNVQNSSLEVMIGLAEDKITWYSNSCCYRSTRFGEEKATWYSNPVWQTIVMVCKKVKLHGSQTMYNIAPKSPPWIGRK